MKRSTTVGSVVLSLLAIPLGLGGAGCAGRPQMFPNSDKNLQKASTEFAADAARRFPYKLDAPRGGEAQARAQVGYMMDVIEIVNLSSEDWVDVEVWINQQYVVFLPTMEKGVLKRLPFQMLYDAAGRYVPTSDYRIEKVEILRDGKMYDVRLQLAD